MAAALRLVMTTCGSQELAEKLATTLVERRLAACVNVLPGIRSTYRWAGAIERAEEILVIIKTTKDGLMPIRDLIRQTTGYELPELIAFDIADGDAGYLAWIADSVEGKAGA